MSVLVIDCISSIYIKTGAVVFGECAVTQLKDMKTRE